MLAGFAPDPSVCRVGDRYYLAVSTFEYLPGIPVFESDDLVSWRRIGHAAPDIDLSTVPDSGGLYAPTLRFGHGRFHIVCTVVGGSGPRGSFLVSADDAAGPWSAPRFVEGADGIDPALFFDVDGTVWWLGCRQVAEPSYPGQTEIWLRAFDLDAARLVGVEHVIWRGALRDAVWSEGPHLHRHDGRYVLVTAEAGTEADHAVVVARADTVTGPYVGDPRNPVFTHRHLGRRAGVQNVGHADLVERPDGSWAALVLGVRSVDRRHVLGRETFLAEVVWEDGWPVFEPATGTLVDRGRGRGPAPEWLGVRAAPPLLGDRLAARDAGTTAVLTRLTRPDARVEVELDSVTGDHGLLLRQSDASALRVERSGGRLRIVERSAGVDREHASVPAGDGPVVFAAALDGGSVELSASSGGVVALRGVVDAAVLSTEVAGGFVGATAGPFVRGEGTVAVVRSATLDGRAMTAGDRVPR